ncbi:hypothetical protein KUTeg_014973 [Tegillarca granosa]|uniref:peptide-methionine (R)-S-oxide reductase n=1 Tax=Tegillarca granosa TaxID=220873 RepID=A0ABQ9ENR8_TEGGR|nr:hypothetical protein KUTeg_014973 [Tegillarca granosa]
MASVGRVLRVFAQMAGKPRFAAVQSTKVAEPFCGGIAAGRISVVCHVNNVKKYSTEAFPADPRSIPNSEWEKKLTSEQYAVCREKNTEPPFSGQYVNHYEKGMYNCVCCGAQLFSSDSKFDSGCGWPSFYEAYSKTPGEESHSNILRRPDNSHGMVRVEVLCKKTLESNYFYLKQTISINK